MQYFVLKGPKVKESLAVTDFCPEEPDILSEETPLCPRCNAVIGPLQWMPPHVVELELWGKIYGDISFGPRSGLLISKRLKDLVHEHGIVGFQGFHPVKVLRVKRRRGQTTEPTPTYFYVTIARSHAAIDSVKSGLERKEGSVCPECRTGGLLRRFKKIVLEPSSWSGEDIFTARGISGTRIVTERFQKVCVENRILNAMFIPVEQYSVSYD